MQLVGYRLYEEVQDMFKKAQKGKAGPAAAAKQVGQPTAFVYENLYESGADLLGGSGAVCYMARPGVGQVWDSCLTCLISCLQLDSQTTTLAHAG